MIQFKDDSFSIYAAITTGILALAYPLLLQVISRLESTYNSLSIVTLFKSLKAYRFLHYSLIIAVSFLIIWTLNFSPIDILGVSLIHTADYLLLIFTLILLINFFWLFKEITKFYSPEKLIKAIQKRSEKDTSLTLFHTMRDLVFYSLEAGVKRREFETSIPTITKILGNYFLKTKEEVPENKKVIFSDQQLNLIADFNEYFSINGTYKSRGVIHPSICSSWLISRTDISQIHSSTYHRLWSNFLEAVKNDSDELIQKHWSVAVCIYSFRNSDSYYQNEINNSEIEFLKFHYLMISLLMSERKYDLLLKLFDYSNSNMEECPLLPKTISDVFQIPSYFQTYSTLEYEWLMNYYFPGYDGIKAEDIKFELIVKLSTLFFLRQYSLSKSFIYKEPHVLNIPDSPQKINLMISSAKLIKSKIDEITKDELINNTFNYCDDKNDNTFFNNEIKNHIKSLEKNLNQARAKVKLDTDKINFFKDESTRIIEDKVKRINDFCNSETSTKNKEYYANLSRVELFKRDTFSENPEISYSGYESTLGTIVGENFQHAFGQVLLRKVENKYLIKKSKLKKSLNKIGDIKKLAIISFNGAFIDELNELKEFYNDLSILNIDTSFHGAIGSSLFVMTKELLPNIDFSNEKELPSFGSKSLECKNKSLNLYTEIIEYEKTNSDNEKWFKEKNEDERSLWVLAVILFKAKFLIPENLKAYRIIEYNEIRNQGISDDPGSIKPIMEK